MTRDEESDVTNFLVGAKTKSEKSDGETTDTKRSICGILFNIVEKNYKIKSSERKIRKRIRTGVNGIEHTVVIENGKLIH